MLSSTFLSNFTPSIWILLLSASILIFSRARKSSLAETKTESPSHVPSPQGQTHPSPKEREAGTWPSSTFRRPRAAPYPNWTLEGASPRGYRPFRHGKYHVTMGIRAMDWDEWIELDSDFPKFHAEKKRRIAARGAACCRTAKEERVMAGAQELLEELAAYLTERYPGLYTETEVGVRNVATGEELDIRPGRWAVNGEGPRDPMELASLLVQDDLALMFEREDGQYYLLAGGILLAGFWRLADKFGLPLSEIHTSGDVPHFREKLERGMNSFFRRLSPERPVLRNNYFVQVDDGLAWSPAIGSEDASEVEGWAAARRDAPIADIHFRSERQSLRRLPRSGAVAFTIRTYFHPVVEIAREPGVPGRLASAVRSWGDEVARYKGRDRYGDVLLEYLDRKHAEQLAEGLVVADEDEENRATRYPW